ncbi:hypothetical protein LTR85_010277 [Meristemomyces frigidus]|nr:hypothetical protein LTR85_010277 [Meristemomyces frigidus]
MVNTSLLHWGTPRQHDSRFHGLPGLSARRRRKNKGKQPVRLDSYAATGKSNFAGYAVLLQEESGTCQPDATDETDVLEGADLVCAAPLTGEAGPSNWPGRPETPSDDASLGPAGDGMEADSHPDVSARSGEKKAQQSTHIGPSEAEIKAPAANCTAMKQHFEMMKPVERAKLKPKYIEDEGFYRGYSDWRQQSVEVRATERTKFEKLMGKFSWPKALKRSRVVIEEPVSPRSRPQTPRAVLDRPSEPKGRRKLFADPDQKEGIPAARVQVAEVEMAADIDTAGSSNRDEHNCATPPSFTPLPSPALKSAAVSEPAYPNGPSATSASSSPARDSGSRYSRRLSTAVWQGTGPAPTVQSKAAGFEKKTGGKPVMRVG